MKAFVFASVFSLSLAACGASAPRLDANPQQAPGQSVTVCAAKGVQVTWRGGEAAEIDYTTNSGNRIKIALNCPEQEVSFALPTMGQQNGAYVGGRNCRGSYKLPSGQQRMAHIEFRAGGIKIENKNFGQWVNVNGIGDRPFDIGCVQK